MKEGTVLAVTRKRLASAVLFTTLSAAGAGEALAQGRLVITNMAVEDCKEMGSCEWRLSCKVGGGAETELVAGAVAASPAEVQLNKAFEDQKFPLTVRCSVWEDDGMVGASWGEPATGSITLPAGGDYTLDLTSAKQGAVKVHLTADSLEMAGAPAAAKVVPASTPAKAQGKGGARRYSGLFRASKGGHAVVVGLDAASFRKKADALAKQGVQLTDLEVLDEKGKRTWSGVFQTREGAGLLITDLEWDPFLARWKELTEQKGMRLIDLETYDDGKKRLFAGAFAESDDLYALWVGMDRKAFEAKWAELSGGGLRLIDVEVYRAGNQTLYSGVFLAGRGGYGMWTDLGWDDLRGKWKNAGTQLVDFDSYVDGGKRRYAAATGAKGPKEALEASLDAAAFAARWREQAAKGYRLMHLESYTE